MAERMARGPARIQLKYKDRKSWREFVVRLRQHSPQGMSNTMARCQALRPSLHDLHDQLSEMTVPVLLAVGDEDVRCLETNLMLKSDASERGPLDLPQYRPCDQSGRARGIQCSGRKFPQRRRTWQLASRFSGNRRLSLTSDAVDTLSGRFARPRRSETADAGVRSFAPLMTALESLHSKYPS